MPFPRLATRTLSTEIVFFLLVSSVTVISADSAESIWLKAPKPKFPPAALKNFVEGSVTVHVRLARDGRVNDARIMKSSGEALLDQTALESVAKWRMNPGWVTPADMNAGRNVVFDFNQEAFLGAVYPDRQAWFSGNNPGIWVFAPAPAYPERARRSRHTGDVLVGITIGPEGKVAIVELVDSSGLTELDDAALTAVRLWRAHKRYAGLKGKVPVTFTLSASRPHHGILLH